MERRKKGFYIYCVAGVDTFFEELKVEGIGRSMKVYPIEYGDVCAVVSDVDLDDFGDTMLERNLSDSEWLESNLRGHENVIEEVMRNRAVIPFKFGIIFSAETRVKELLEQNYDEFKNLLNKLKDKREWAIKVYCNIEELKRALRKSNAKINELKEEISKKSVGAAYFLTKQVEDILSKEADQKVVRYAEEFCRKFREFADNSTLSPLWSREITGKDADMILNATYLVDAKKENLFLSIFQSFKEHVDDGLMFECTGPWPPYNFVSLPVRRILDD